MCGDWRRERDANPRGALRANAGLIVASQALYHQRADYDVDIARVLEYGIGDRLHVQLECLSEMIGELRAQEQDENDRDDEREGAALQ
jgi:hypothetical protein